jgi:hypothetical protein
MRVKLQSQTDQRLHKTVEIGRSKYCYINTSSDTLQLLVASDSLYTLFHIIFMDTPHTSSRWWPLATRDATTATIALLRPPS